MTNPSALITGASRGIGYGIAHRLAERGYSLTIAARDTERLAAAATAMRAAGAPEVHEVAGDLADEGYLATLVNAHADNFGRMDVLVLNAGAGSAGELAEFHPKRFDKQVALNLRAPFVLLQEAIPLLRKAAAEDPVRGAKVLALASITGVYAEPELSAYGATKAALMSLIRSVNREEASKGIRATALAPAYVDTDMAEFKHEVIPPTEMISVADLVELADACLRLTARSTVQEIVVARSSSDGYRA
ncbi:SDR family oxidoreductase [Rhodococcus rhodochrous]|uniref:Short-chain dehydrogenase n=1 Tax=Rhodococcus rhodochrous KG-21 TaxID=1441923 RepID=A0A0M9WPH6_RHORH|nr:SDR family oxidoreductase [Rhodococcus rhodochrous]KOS56711.1 short-chain dehydrogenase [Rhodococcus rhodochrous KG-21]